MDKAFPSLGNCGYDVDKYELHLSWDAQEDVLFGNETVVFHTTQKSSELTFDLGVRHAVDTVEVNGTSAAYRRTENKLIIEGLFHSETPYTLHIVYQGMMPRGTVLTPADYEEKHRGESFLTMAEPNRAREFFLCNDHPRDKAIFELYLTVPAEYTAASGGRLKEVREVIGVHGKVKEFHYEYAEPMAAYLFAFSAAPFDVFSSVDSSGRVRMDFIDTTLSPEDYEAAKTLTEKVPEMINFLQGVLGPYPFQDIGSIVGSPVMNAAFETQTRPTYDSKSIYEINFVHELAHQWLGNWVSLEDWSDLWLKEGFAEFASALWLKHTAGDQAFQGRILEDYRLVVNSDQRPVSWETLWNIMSAYPEEVLFDPVSAEELSAAFLGGPLRKNQRSDLDHFLNHSPRDLRSFFSVLLPQWEGDLFLTENVFVQAHEKFGPNPLDEYRKYVQPSVGPKGFDFERVPLSQIYGTQTYQAGALVYYVIWDAIGEENFIQSLHLLMTRYAGQSVSAEDVFSVFGEVSGVDISELVRPWLVYDGHVPDLPGLSSYDAVRK